MFTTREFIVAEDPVKRHVLFCLAVLTLLALGMYLFYIAGFRFENTGIVVLNSELFLAFIYTGRWLCTTWYLTNRLKQNPTKTKQTTLGLAIVDFIFIKYI